MTPSQGIDRRAAPPPDVPGVAEVTAALKAWLEGRFDDVWVAGEVSSVTRASSGHLYLSLKDDTAVLRAVVWRGALAQLAITPEDGLEVVCHGRIEVYPPRGSYQLTIDRMHAVGTGALEARLRRLHAALDAEGLFSPQRKRPLPAYPRRIAVVTSPSGAALHDFLETLRGRWPVAEVFVVPSRVQGAGAAEEVARALASAARIAPAVDVIALVRGGGSLEDLWAFNEEALVRAVAASPIPVVSGVGHEIDVSLADLAADVRALTPTDAAVRVAPDRRELLASVTSLAGRVEGGLLRRVADARARLEAAGLLSRAEIRGGDFLRDPLPRGADVVTLIRIVHDQDDARALALLRNIRQALEPGATLLVIEAMSGVKGAEPLDAYYGFYTLAMGRGEPRRVEEIEALLKQSGFGGFELLANALPTLTSILVAKAV